MTLEDKIRSIFEKWISSPPIEAEVERFPDDPEKHSWHGNYKNLDVQLAFEAFVKAWELSKDAIDEEREKHFDTKYVALYRAGDQVAVITYLMDKALAPPHPSHFIGSFPIHIPKWVLDKKVEHPWDKPHPLELCE